MYLKFIITLLILISYKSHALDAHVHGVVNIDIAVEKNEVLFMIKSPSESFLGFEYKPKTKKEVMQVRKLRRLLAQRPYDLFEDSKLKECKVSAKKWEQYFSGKNHSSIYTETYMNCGFKPDGLKLKMKIFKLFPNIKAVHLQVLTNANNISKKLNNDKFEFKL